MSRAERFAAARRVLVTWSAPRSAMLTVGICVVWGWRRRRSRSSRRGRCRSCSRIIAAICPIERGLSDHTVFGAYEAAARLFRTAVADPHSLDLDRLCAAQMSSFLASECPKRQRVWGNETWCAGCGRAALPACGWADRDSVGVGRSFGRGSV